jgi:hypothetical protein
MKEIEKKRFSPGRRVLVGMGRRDIHVHGDNSRVNLNSTDNSMNITIKSDEQLFQALRDTTNSIRDDADRAAILAESTFLRRRKVRIHSWMRIRVSYNRLRST